MVREITVDGVTYRGPLNNSSADLPFKITSMAPSDAVSTGGRPVGRSWQTWQAFPTEESALAALVVLEAGAQPDSPPLSVPSVSSVPTSPVIEPEVLPARRRPGRSSEIAGRIEARPIAERIERINQYHQATATMFAQSACCALLCGYELLAARAEIGPGKWLAWVEANCAFDRTTAWRYMTAARHQWPQIEHVAHVQHLAVETPSAAMSDTDRAALMDVIRGSVGDRTWRQLALDLGVIQPESDDVAHVQHDGQAERKATRSRQEAARELWLERVHELYDMAFKRKSHLHLKKNQLREVYEMLGDVRQALKEAM